MCEVILALDCGGSSIKAAVIREKEILETRLFAFPGDSREISSEPSAPLPNGAKPSAPPAWAPPVPVRLTLRQAKAAWCTSGSPSRTLLLPL